MDILFNGLWSEFPLSPGLGDLFAPVLIHDELCSLAGWINDEGIAVEALDHYGIFCAKVIGR